MSACQPIYICLRAPSIRGKDINRRGWTSSIYLTSTSDKTASRGAAGEVRDDLKELEKLKKNRDGAKTALETAQNSYKTLHSGDVDSQAKHKELVKNISKVTVTLDDHTFARKFAEHLLKALEGIAKLDALKKVLPIYGVDLALLQSTMQNVANLA